MREQKRMRWRRRRRRERGYKEMNEKFKRLEIMERRERSNCTVGSNKWTWETKRTMEHSRYTNCPSQTAQDTYIKSKSPKQPKEKTNKGRPKMKSPNPILNVNTKHKNKTKMKAQLE
jgi:hypothetical protein